MSLTNLIHDLPTTRHEDYKYTNIQKLFKGNFTVLNSQQSQTIAAKKLNKAYNIEFRGNELVSNDCEQLKITPLEKVKSDILKKFHTTSSDPLSMLAEKTLQGGYLLEVDSAINQPIFIQRTFAECEGHLITSRIYLWVKSGAVSLLEQLYSPEDTSFIQSNNLNIVVEASANCSYILVNSLESGQHSLSTTNAKIFKQSDLKYYLFNVGGGTSRFNYNLSLEQELANADIYGLYAGKGNEHIDTQVFIHHKAPRTTSDQIFKTTLQDNSRGIFTGKVRVEKHAQQINAKQLNKNLLLSTKAKAHSRPQLEIFADDVKCSHGSTTGQLSPEELFYFTARGIAPEKARHMLIRAMSSEVILKIKDPVLRSKVEELIKDHQAN